MPSPDSLRRLENLPLDRIRDLCRRYHVEELAIFGSALREDFGPESDVDLMVRFRPGVEQPWMAHFQHLEDELSRLLDHPVDLVAAESVERSRNWIRRRAILGSSRILYAA